MPSAENCIESVVAPQKYFYSNVKNSKGKVFPDFEADGKTKISTILYLSLTSCCGYQVIVYANFPEEKAIIEKQDTLNTMKKTKPEVVKDTSDNHNKKKN